MRYYTTSFRGLGTVTRRELIRKVEARTVGRDTVRDYDLVHFEFDGRPAELGDLTTAEDVFAWLGETDLNGDREDANAIARVIAASPVEEAIVSRSAITPRKGHGPPTYRVIVQAEDSEWRHYRRDHLQKAAALALKAKHPRWQEVDDDAHLEIWVQLADRKAILGLRMSDRTMRHRDYKVANIPGSLRPTVAASLVFLSRPEPDNIFLDPMCGAGTILVERALAGRHSMLLGGDISEEAVEVTHTNFGPRHKPWEVRSWDATQLPVEDRSVSCVVTNPPWGRQIGDRRDIADLYVALLKEIARVLSPGGRAVFLTSEWDALKSALNRTPSLYLVEHLRDIRVMGRRTDIFVTMSQ